MEFFIPSIRSMRSIPHAKHERPFPVEIKAHVEMVHLEWNTVYLVAPTCYTAPLSPSSTSTSPF